MWAILSDANGTPGSPGTTMVTAGARLLRSLARAGKAQRRTVSKLVKNLFAKPAAKPKPPPPRIKPPPPRPGVGRPRVPALPGKWLASHYSTLSELGTLPGRRMSYWLYLPDKAPSAATSRGGLPLIVMLHGCEQTATQFAQGTRMNRLAEHKGYALLYPQQSLSMHARRCWKWYDKATQQGGGGVKMIVGIIEQVAAKYAIDRSRIYICGISAGAAMADIVALNHPQLIAAVGLHSGPVFGAVHSALGALRVMQNGANGSAEGPIAEILDRNPAFPEMPTLLIQGAGDQVVRPINQSQLLQQSLLLNRLPRDSASTLSLNSPARGGSQNPAHAYAVRDFYAGRKLLLRVVHIEQLGHAWSGGDSAVPFTAKAGPDASKMMLDFFARHQRR